MGKNDIIVNDTKISVVIINVFISYLLVVLGVIFRPIMYVAFVYVCVKLFLSKDKFAVTLLLVPLAHVAVIFKLSPQSSSLFTYIQIIAVIKYFLLNRKINSKVFLYWFFFMIYLIIGFLLNSIYVGFSNITDLIKVCMWPLLFYFLIDSVDNENKTSVLKLYVVCVFITSVLGLTSTFIPNMEAFVTYKDVHLGKTDLGFISAIRFSGLVGDANFYSILLIIAVLISIFLWRKNAIKAWMFYVIYFCLAALGGMTGSKSFLVMLVVVTIVIIYELFKIKKYRSGIAFSIIIFLAVFLLVSGYISAFDLVFNRLNGVTTVNDLTTGRSELWSEYIENILRNPLKCILGNGIGVGHSFVHYPHNTYIDFVDILGIAGTILLLLTLFYSIKVKNRLEHDNRFWLGFLPVMFMYFSLSMFYSTDLVFQLFVISCFVL